MIEESYEEDLNIAVLAEKLGMTDRHLRRLFSEHLGASPIEIMITKRLHLAKQLVTQTDQSVSEIAFAVGFESIRRFNEAFKKGFKTSPSDMRKKQGKVAFDDSLSLTLPFREPFAWEEILKYLHRHAAYGIERVSKENYMRFFPLGSSFSSVKVALLENKKPCLWK